MDANALLMSGGLASAKFPTIGTSITGKILRNPEARQQTDIETGEPLTFASGEPRMQIVVALATDERDPANEDDDGERSLYIKGNMLGTVRDAVRKSGAKGLEVGGTLTVTYIADGEKKNRAFNPPKLYAASYQPPTAQAANDVLMGTAQQWQPTQPDPTPAVAPAPTVTAPAPQGIDPAMWARMGNDQKQTVLAAMGLPGY